jgi:isoquinoline 1-oxidoreductase beta subunit
MGKWTRRTFIGVGSVIGGGLALGIGEFAFAPNRLKLAPGEPLGDGVSRLTTWIKIAGDNTVTVVVPHCEMGQGSQTGLAMMLAEELDADWNLIRVEEAAALDEYASGYMVRGFGGLDSPPTYMLRGMNHLTYKIADWMGLQVTGGSGSIRFTGEYGMRVAGATARAMLIDAAANRWNVAASECVASDSFITHPAGHRASYGELASDAAALKPPMHPPLKSREQFKIIGTSRKRFDMPSKVDGTATFGIDIVRPDMLHAAIKAAPVFGGKLHSVDAATVNTMPGVIRVVELESAVAVVAKSYWQAKKALDQLAPQFSDEGNNADSAAIFTELTSALDMNEGSKVAEHGEGASALSDSQIAAEYRVPYLAHATMEPMNATVQLSEDRCEVWLGTQDPLHARGVAAKAADIAKDNVVIHNQQLGGGFGRRLPGTHDYLDQAVRIAKVMSPTPVKLLWSREEDFRHDYYRSAVLGRYQATLDAQGNPHAWVARFTGDAGDNAAKVHYDIPHQSIYRTAFKNHVRLGAWRSVDHTQHGFFTEIFIDELAHAAKQDPFEYRRKLLAKLPRHLAALELAAAKAGWDTPLASNQGRGIAIVESFGTIVCEVAEVEVNDSVITVKRVVATVDCGDVVNPSAALAQIEGGILFGLSAALYGEITLDKGAVVQSNFHDHPLLRINEAPQIEVHFIASHAKRGGLGEPGVPPIAPAVVNAIFAATGKRIRELPIKRVFAELTTIE